MFGRINRPTKKSPVGSYKMEVISLPEECDWVDHLPDEIQYIFKKYPQYIPKIRKILSQGKAIGVRTVLHTPENILKAIHTISVHSQGNYIVTWLPDLLKHQKKPVFIKSDYVEAKEHKEDLDQSVQIITTDRLKFKKLVLIDEENIGISESEKKFMHELSELIYPLAVDYSIYRVISDNARERTHMAQTIIKALFIVGPVAHVLEKIVSGFGKLVAASADDILGETAEIFALRGSGFKWKELIKRGRILIPVFALATYGAFSVEPLIVSGHIIWAGVVFGVSAVALSLTTAVQSFFMYRHNIKKLMFENKVAQMSGKQLTKLSFIQDFTNPARLGLIMGASLAPLMGIIASLLNLMHNGWVLATVGSTESIVAGITVVFSGRINEFRFKRKLKRL